MLLLFLFLKNHYREGVFPKDTKKLLFFQDFFFFIKKGDVLMGDTNINYKTAFVVDSFISF